MFGRILKNSTNAPLLMKSLDAAMLRQRVIANNIANVNTPGYRRMEVSFEEQLREALKTGSVRGRRTHPDHMPTGRPKIQEVNAEAYHPVDPTLPSGVNNVDIDMEMAKLAENQLMFNYGVRFAKGMYTKLNSAIQARSIPVG